LAKRKKTRKKKKAVKPIKKYRGFAKGSLYNRVKKIIWAEHKSEFANYTEFIRNKIDEDGVPIPKSSYPVIVMSEIRKINNFTDADILRIYTYHKSLADSSEAVAPLESEIMPYWYVGLKSSHRGISKLVEYFDGLTPNISVICPRISSKVAQFEASTYVDDDYYRLFKEWVDWCNRYTEEHDMDSDDTICFTFTEPYKCLNRNGRWEVELFPCDVDGVENDYGYKPSVVDNSLLYTKKLNPETGEITEEGIDFVKKADIKPTEDEETETKQKTKNAVTEKVLLEREKTAQKKYEYETQKLATIKELASKGFSMDDIIKLVGGI